jgi:DNA-binding CsgD family transcriptional regulator
MKRYISIFIFLILLVSSLEAEAYEIRGQLKNVKDTTYACFSFIHSSDDFLILGEYMVIQKVKVKKDGSFLIKGNELPRGMRFYRLSFCEDKDMVRYTLGEYRNNLTLYMNNDTDISFNASIHDFMLKDVKLKANNEVCGRLKVIDDEMQLIIHHLFDKITNGQKDVIRSKVVEYIESYLDTCDLAIIHYYMYVYSLGYDLESDRFDEKLIYSKMNDQEPDSIYTKELAFRLGIENNSISWYVWSLIILLFAYSLIITLLYISKEKRQEKQPMIILTVKEKKILSLIADGKLNKEIAEILSVEISTVKTHVSNLYKKIGVTKRSEAVDYFNRTNN